MQAGMYVCRPIAFPWSPQPSWAKYEVVDTEVPDNPLAYKDEAWDRSLFQGTKKQCQDFACMMNNASEERIIRMSLAEQPKDMKESKQ